MATTRPGAAPGGPRPAVDYPASDGKPMAETDLHRQDLVDLIETLKDHLAAEEDGYVSGDLLLYDVEGNPRRSVAPTSWWRGACPSGRRGTTTWSGSRGKLPTWSSRSPRRRP